MTTTIRNMRPVGRDGELVLYSDKGNKNGILYDEVRNTQSEKQPLQVFFKWGNFVAIEDDEEQ